MSLTNYSWRTGAQQQFVYCNGTMRRAIISILIIYSVFADASRPNIIVIMADDLVSFLLFI
jgi:hypothetical protein